MTRDESRERCETLVTRAVDGVLAAVEAEELEPLLERYPDLRAELEDFRAIKESTDAMRERILEDARIEPFRPDGATRGVVGVGLALMLVASLSLVGFAAWAVLTDAGVPLVLRLVVGAGGAGLLLLFLHVLRLRARGHGRDPYREIDL